MTSRLLSLAAGITLAACTTNPNTVEVTLEPDIVSSLDGTLAVHAVAMHDRDIVSNRAIAITVDYTDRNGTTHDIAEVDGKTDQRGEFDATLTGLTWDGTGAVHAKVASGPEGDATFSVLDRTPPKVSITPPPNNQIHQQMGTEIAVQATDEIGVSQVVLQVNGVNNNGGGNGNRSLITNGSQNVMLTFQIDAGNTQIGETLTLSALAADLSGNEGVATPVTVTVIQ